MAFINTQLDLSVDLDMRGGPSFRTEIIQMGQGLEARQAHWAEDLGRWQSGERRINETEKNYLLGFFRSVQGMTNSWRFKDWTDFIATAENIGTGDDVETQFQLKRTFGSVTKTIYLPVVGMTKIYFDTVEQLSGWSVDDQTGIVTFSTAPTIGVAITADFEYDKPCRFDVDQFACQFQATTRSINNSDGKALYWLASLPIQELRTPS